MKTAHRKEWHYRTVKTATQTWMSKLACVTLIFVVILCNKNHIQSSRIQTVLGYFWIYSKLYFLFRSIIFLWNRETASDFISSPLYSCQVLSLPLKELPATQPSKITTPFAELWIQDLAHKEGGNVFQILLFLNTVVVLSLSI